MTNKWKNANISWVHVIYEDDADVRIHLNILASGRLHFEHESNLMIYHLFHRSFWYMYLRETNDVDSTHRIFTLLLEYYKFFIVAKIFVSFLSSHFCSGDSRLSIFR